MSEIERAEIIAAIEAGEPRNEIARRFERSGGTITRIATESGLSFERAQTRAATAARRADLAARRVLVAEAFLSKAEQALDAIDGTFVLHNWYQGGYAEVTVEVPPTGDRKNLMITAAIVIEKHLELERHESGDEDEARGALRDLMDLLRLNAQRATQT
jgi:hypothetical protein